MSIRISKNLLAELKDKEYREIFVEEFIVAGLPFQIRALREARGWTQKDLAEKAGMKQSAVSRIENPSCGTLNLKTLLRLAAVFDVALTVRFAAFATLLKAMQDLSPQTLSVPSFSDDVELQEMAGDVSRKAVSSRMKSAYRGLAKVSSSKTSSS